MSVLVRGAMACLFVGAFGLFLVWKGVRKDVPRTTDGRVLFPPWVYIVCGLFTLVLPIAFIVLLFCSQ
jgi:hypothetical protein